MPARRLYAALTTIGEGGGPQVALGRLLEALSWMSVKAIVIAHFEDRNQSRLSLLGAGISSDYLKRYAERRYDRLSGTLRAMRATKSPVRWHLGAGKPADSQEAEIDAGAIAEGLSNGVAIPIYSAESDLRGWVALATNSHDATEAADIFACQLIGLTVFDRIVAVEQHSRNTSQPGLSERELAVLSETANGLTTKEIAKLLNISNRTVEFHLANVSRKFGTRNKVHSVSHAILNGIISERDDHTGDI